MRTSEHALEQAKAFGQTERNKAGHAELDLSLMLGPAAESGCARYLGPSEPMRELVLRSRNAGRFVLVQLTFAAEADEAQ
jgi:hypothetical protein